MRITDIALAFPVLLLAIAVTTVVRPSLARRRHRHRGRALDHHRAPGPRPGRPGALGGLHHGGRGLGCGGPADHPPAHPAPCRALCERAAAAGRCDHHPVRGVALVPGRGRAGVVADVGLHRSPTAPRPSGATPGCRCCQVWPSPAPSSRSRSSETPSSVLSTRAGRSADGRRHPLAPPLGGGGAHRRVWHRVPAHVHRAQRPGALDPRRTCHAGGAGSRAGIPGARPTPAGPAARLSRPPRPGRPGHQLPARQRARVRPHHGQAARDHHARVRGCRGRPDGRLRRSGWRPPGARAGPSTGSPRSWARSWSRCPRSSSRSCCWTCSRRDSVGCRCGTPTSIPSMFAPWHCRRSCLALRSRPNTCGSAARRCASNCTRTTSGPRAPRDSRSTGPCGVTRCATPCRRWSHRPGSTWDCCWAGWSWWSRCSAGRASVSRRSRRSRRRTSRCSWAPCCSRPLCIVLANLAADIAVMLLDPRTRDWDTTR